ncbi:MAG: hypothetical protein SGJ27_28185 [Candidatus Melainabacteria bacterium]|nr:hypothetical protein [Candidatus Melainabacteria bacterium]
MTNLNIFILLVAANVIFMCVQFTDALSGEPKPILTSSAAADKDYDPGKEITDDPHGPSTKGPNPHGRDPYDEIHDKNLPANNPDPYLGDHKD